jgi:hypothetical protein
MAAEVIIVTNQHGYIGTSTKAEMVYAAQTGKEWDIREFHLPEPTPNKYAPSPAPAQLRTDEHDREEN